LTCTVKPSSHSANLTVLLTDLENRSGNQRDEDTGSTATFMATDGLTLISGNERVFPADYEQADIKAHIPLTELYVGDELLGGTVTAVGVVWPDPGGDTVTLDHPQSEDSYSTTAFRLTDIPIKNK
jgi:ompA/motB domain protein